MPNGDAHPFEVQLTQWLEVHELPDDWSAPQLALLLDHLEIEGVEEGDQLDMAIMGLQDLDADDAADLVLQTVFAERLKPGVRQNLIDDLEDDRPWEDFADLRHQPGIFSAMTLLQKAFPTRFGKPDIARVEVSIRGEDSQARRWLQGEIDPALLLRLLAGGMPDRAVLRRLFGEALGGIRFDEADAILWRVERNSPADAAVTELTLYSSLQWFDPLKEADTWSVQAWPDAPPRAVEE
jgi:hypothetical protein